MSVPTELEKNLYFYAQVLVRKIFGKNTLDIYQNAVSCRPVGKEIQLEQTCWVALLKCCFLGRLLFVIEPYTGFHSAVIQYQVLSKSLEDIIFVKLQETKPFSKPFHSC